MGMTDILSLLGGTCTVSVRNAYDEQRPGSCCRKQNEVDFGEADLQPH